MKQSPLFMFLIPKRFFTLINKHHKNHYDILGVTPKATQADIKSAYYKLSMMYHPDRNQGCNVSAVKFQAITAAYEVLGDYKARKLYDRGISVSTTENITEEVLKTRRSSVVQKTRPVKSTQSPIFNYDEWSKAHYGESITKRSKAKAAYEHNKRVKEEEDQSARNRNLGIAFLLMFGLFFIVSRAYDDNDKPIDKYKK